MADKQGTGERLIKLLSLAPHPEGGHYRETFRDQVALDDGRACATAIYFLLQSGEVSRWHRVDATEIWHWYDGAPLELRIAPVDGPATTLRLGPDVESGAAPQQIVPAGYWQSARTVGTYTLVGCTVSPGFDFRGFTLADPRFEPGTGGGG
jgi:uncharacterized protein